MPDRQEVTSGFSFSAGVRTVAFIWMLVLGKPLICAEAVKFPWQCHTFGLSETVYDMNNLERELLQYDLAVETKEEIGLFERYVKVLFEYAIAFGLGIGSAFLRLFGLAINGKVALRSKLEKE
eukprot:s2801_g9.t1